tara:strand:- start:329 stop:718 length:390 start_codon:yes stop_codon:yes gene_type:complete
MKNYKITTPHNGCIQYTQTGKDLWCTILDKFNIEYKIEEINSTNSNDIPHSEIRRMESEGVLEKFDKSNSSSDSDTPKDIQDWEETSFGKAHKKFTTNVGDFDDIENSEYDAVSIPKKSEPYIDDDYDY